MKYHYGQKVEYLSYETPDGVWKPGKYDYYRNGLHYVLADNNGSNRVSVVHVDEVDAWVRRQGMEGMPALDSARDIRLAAALRKGQAA